MEAIDPVREGPLTGMRFVQAGVLPAAAYAGRLLASLGAEVVTVGGGTGARWPAGPTAAVIDAGGVPSGVVPSGPVVDGRAHRSGPEEWAASGAMALTDRRGAGAAVTGAVAVAMRGASVALEVLAACRGRPLAIDGPALLGERAALSGLGRGTGTTSVSGSSHLVECGDGWVAVSLNRAGDLDLLPAWLERSAPLSVDDVRRAGRDRRAAPFADRAQLLGIPAAVVGPPAAGDEQLAARGGCWPPPPLLAEGRARPGARADRTPLVVDLSALWAGPLATSLLVMAGCRVVKVEDPGRPDATRSGPRAFFDLMNAGKESAAVPFRAGGPLADLVAAADVVVEASRPRAVEQLGIGRAPGQLWASITGYGRTGPWRQRVALGDDAAAAGGLVVRGAGGVPLFCGDAAADPVTGLHAAVAILAGIVGGFDGTLDLAMREVVGYALGADVAAGAADAVRPATGGGPGEAPPRARVASGPGPALGQDTDAVLRSL